MRREKGGSGLQAGADRRRNGRERKQDLRIHFLGMPTMLSYRQTDISGGNAFSGPK